MPRVRMKVDGITYDDEVEARLLLVHYLRDRLGQVGTPIGCDTSNCGSCTVHLNGHSVKSCTVLTVQADGAEITTIQGLAQDGQLHAVQLAFADSHALQCGYCTPGMILTAWSLLRANPQPSREQIVRGMEDNFCRCGAHTRIIDAIQTAAATMKGAL